jgi:hypothetical protein
MNPVYALAQRHAAKKNVAELQICAKKMKEELHDGRLLAIMKKVCDEVWKKYPRNDDRLSATKRDELVWSKVGRRILRLCKSWVTE